MNFINKIFGSKSQKKLKKITPLVSSINNLEDGYSLLSDEELKNIEENLYQDMKEENHWMTFFLKLLQQ